MGEWDAWVGRELQAVRDAGQWREVRDFDALGPAGSPGGSGTQPPLRSGTQPPLRSGPQPPLRSGTQPPLRS
ncbi:MAG TPA: hypothetical protein VG455_00805, partial [Acidimicrobiales bacterium]|nr:hypothetical protein [Acidimicrobiales bacterium]